jgi:hypothetical protein
MQVTTSLPSTITEGELSRGLKIVIYKLAELHQS